MLLAIALAPFAQVMVLGTYHFADAGRDGVKTKIQSAKSAQRQKEIADVAEQIAKFRPTMIAIEATPDRAEAINRDYQAYRNGTYALTANEIDQLGFRIGKLAEVPRLAPIDNHLDLAFDQLMKFLGTHDPARAQHLGAAMQGIGAKFEAWDKQFSVGQMLAIHNSAPYIRESYRFYVSLSDVTDGKEFPGADICGDWYKRNARIYGNLRRSIKKGDRVLVIYGSGHSKLLRDLIQDSGDLQLVEASKYLPHCPVRPAEIRFID